MGANLGGNMQTDSFLSPPQPRYHYPIFSKSTMDHEQSAIAVEQGLLQAGYAQPARHKSSSEAPLFPLSTPLDGGYHSPFPKDMFANHELEDGLSLFDFNHLTVPSAPSMRRRSSTVAAGIDDPIDPCYTPNHAASAAYAGDRLPGDRPFVPDKMFLDDKAADLCQRWLTNYSPCWPEEKDFEAFERLTGESVTRIKTWFGQRLSQQSSRPSFGGGAQFDHGFSGFPMTPASSFPNSRRGSYQSNIYDGATNENTTAQFHSEDPARSLSPVDTFKPDIRQCAPTRDARKLTWEEERPFQCTHKCGQRFPRKGEWVKHEQKNHPQRVWLCMVGAVLELDGTQYCWFCRQPNPTSAHMTAEHWDQSLDSSSTAAAAAAAATSSYAAEPGCQSWCRKQFMRKDHLLVHLRTVHKESSDFDHYEAISRLDVPDELDRWYRWCGFCKSENCFARWKDRMDHVARHFKKERRTMSEWASVDVQHQQLTEANPAAVRGMGMTAGD